MEASFYPAALDRIRTASCSASPTVAVSRQCDPAVPRVWPCAGLGGSAMVRFSHGGGYRCWTAVHGQEAFECTLVRKRSCRSRRFSRRSAGSSSCSGAKSPGSPDSWSSASRTCSPAESVRGFLHAPASWTERESGLPNPTDVCEAAAPGSGLRGDARPGTWCGGRGPVLVECPSAGNWRLTGSRWARGRGMRGKPVFDRRKAGQESDRGAERLTCRMGRSRPHERGQGREPRR